MSHAHMQYVNAILTVGQYIINFRLDRGLDSIYPHLTVNVSHLPEHYFENPAL